MKKLVFGIVLTLMLTVSAAAETSLWVVRGEGTLTYLGGTCHLLRADDYPLPEEFDSAYADVRRVVFETDPGRLNSPEIQQEFLRRAVYPGDETLDRVLSPRTWKLLQEHCSGVGIPLDALKKLKPSMLAMTLLVMELQRHGATREGVDLHLYQKAESDGKEIGELETAEQQLGFILSMGEGDEDRFIEYALSDMHRLGKDFDSLIAAWRSGSESELSSLTSADFRKDFPEVFRMLFTDRNAQWLPLIEKYIESPEKEMILVGVGHLVGQDGLVEALRKRGYSVQKMK